jgi:hypothetical protein
MMIKHTGVYVVLGLVIMLNYIFPTKVLADKYDKWLWEGGINRIPTAKSGNPTMLSACSSGKGLKLGLGDEVTFEVNFPLRMKEAILVLRYAGLKPGKTGIDLFIDGKLTGESPTLSLSPTGGKGSKHSEWKYGKVIIGDLKPGKHLIKLVAKTNGSRINVDGFFICDGFVFTPKKLFISPAKMTRNMAFSCNGAQLRTSKNSLKHPITNIADGNSGTAWCAPVLQDSWIKILFPKPVQIDRLSILAASLGVKWWSKPKGLTISYSDGTSVQATIKNKSGKWLNITVNKKTSFVKINVDSIYARDKQPWGGFSEIRLLQYGSRKNNQFLTPLNLLDNNFSTKGKKAKHVNDNIRKQLVLAGERISFLISMRKTLKTHAGINSPRLNKAIEESNRLLMRLKETIAQGNNTKASQQFTELDTVVKKAYKFLDIPKKALGIVRDIADLKDLINIQTKEGILSQTPKKAYEDCIALLNKIIKDFKNDNPASLNSQLADLKIKEAELRDAIKNSWGKLPKYSPGVGRKSFGRFGWIKQDGILANKINRNSLSRPFYKYINIFTNNLFFEPGEAEPVSAKVDSISWTSVDWRHIYETKTGKRIKWDLKYSLLFPGFLLDTDSEQLDISMSITQRSSPNKIMIPAKQGALLLSRTDKGLKNSLANMSENWLLLLSENDMREVPRLLVFQKKPDKISWSKDKIIFHRKGGVGYIGFAEPYGLDTLKSNISKDWKNGIPKKVISRCRQLAGMLFTYPYKCLEFFSVDERKRTVRLRNDYEYIRVKDEWNTSGIKIAPLPPLLAFAIQEGYPARVISPYKNLHIPTNYGPYWVAEGNNIEYELPIPKLDAATYLKTGNYPKLKDAANYFVKNFSPYSKTSAFAPGAELWVCPSAYSAWAILDKEARQMLDKASLYDTNRLVKQRDKLKSLAEIKLKTSTRLHAYRVEPFSGTDYLLFGWPAQKFGMKLFGDITNYSGAHLYAMYNYAKYSGDWETVRQRWDYIKERFRVNEARQDWAVMGQDCMEYGISHKIDMGPDSFKAPLAMLKMAKIIGDRQMYEKGAYLAAKQAIPLCMAFHQYKWTLKYVNFVPEDCLLEAGYSEAGVQAIRNTTWDVTFFPSAVVAGVIHASELYDLYLELIPKAIKRFEYLTLEKHLPDLKWCDPRFRIKGKRHSRHTGISLTTHSLMRHFMGEDTKNIEKYYRKASSLAKNYPEKEKNLTKFYRKNISLYAFGTLQCSLISALIGRDAPAYLISWEPAALMRGDFVERDKKVFLRFDSKEKFTIRLRSDIKQKTIMVNARKLSSANWEYIKDKDELRINLPRGDQKIVISYPDWTGKAWQKPEVVDFNVTEEALRQRWTKLARETGSLINEADFTPLAKLIPVNIDKFANMDLKCRKNKNGSWGWMGIGHGMYPHKMGNGKQTFRGVRFNIIKSGNNSGRAAIGLFGENTKFFPREVKNIPVNKKFKYLYFLHAAGWNVSDGGEVAQYKINYKDGTTVTVPIHSGKDIADWWGVMELLNAKAVKFPGESYGLYVSRWENKLRDEEHGVVIASQKSLRTIKSIDLISKSKSTIMLVAITGELNSE